MLITDQVATAPCTDRVQARRPTFEAKPLASMSRRTLFPSTRGAPAAREKAWSASSRTGGALARSIRSRCRVVLIARPSTR
jgi:hypothetical protein